MSTGEYELPPERFDAYTHATNRLLKAQQTKAAIVALWTETYHDWYGIKPGGGSIYTREQFQLMLDEMPEQSLSLVLSDSQRLVEFFESSRPGSVEEKYKQSAFPIQVGADGSVVVGDLLEVWKEPAPAEPGTEPAEPGTDVPDNI